MKTLIKKTIATSLAIIGLLFTIPAIANSSDSVERDNDEKAQELTAEEIEEIMVFLDNDIDEFADDSITYEFYNANDELILSKTVKKDEVITDKKFITLKAKSDLLMEIGNTSIYRQ